MMYLVIWLTFFEILLVLFPVLGTSVADGLHVLVGIAVVAMALTVSKNVKATACPDRIKRITKATANFSIAQAVLGALIFLAMFLHAGSIIQGFITFLHVGIALAIITQASSSATSYDMWEEKEFLAIPSKPSA
jgi:hypothetical protein